MTQRWDDTLFQPTQWYPRVAVYDDLRGWDTEPYLGPSEFYNNFGRFDVSIDVPAGWIVSGTGVLQNPQRGADDRGARAPRRTCSSPTRRARSSAPDEVGPGQATARRRSAHVALRRRHGERLRLGHGEEVRLAGDARHDSRQGPDSRQHATTCRATPRCTPTPARSRATRSSSTRSSGCPYPFPQFTLQ